MAWIRTVGYAEAQGKLKKLYERVKGPDGQIDRILMAHGLRPHTLQGHMALYKSVLHHSANRLPEWLLEALGVYVSLLNGCDYCVQHHYQGLRRLLSDEERGRAVLEALRADRPQEAFQGRELALMAYARALTLTPKEVGETMLDELREAGMDDGEILEANQVIAYFAYANRTVLGLGVNPAGETLGLSPNVAEDAENWNHN